MFITEYQEYCKKNDMIELIHKYKGDINFIAEFEYISFFFDIQNFQKDYFLSVLKLFAEFFTNVLPEKDKFMQNRDNIKEEFQLALNFAKDRVDLPLLSSFTCSDHPINKDNEDYFIKIQKNLDYTILYEELQKFAKCYYSAHRIKLVIQASLSLNTLEKYVTHSARFVNIPSNVLPSNDSTGCKQDIPHFNTAAFQKMYKIIDIKPFKLLEITWVIPSQYSYKNKSFDYIMSIIENEGEGSLISYLRKKLWSVTCYNKAFLCESVLSSMFNTITISIKLFNDGKHRVREVLNAIFSYINLLKREGPQKRIYDELNTYTKYIFRYKKEQCSLENVKNLCGNMHVYSPRDYITGNIIYFEYDSEEINKFLSYLVPETANIIIIDKHFEGVHPNKINSYSNLWYTDVQIPQQWIEQWKSIEPLPDFYLPLKNIWLPFEWTLIPIPAKVSKYPVKLYSDSISEVWYRPDPKFRLPVCYMNVHFVSYLGFESPENAALMTLYCEILKLLVMEELYPATIAGYSYDINVNTKGITIEISGYMPRLMLSFIVNRMKAYPKLVTEELFKLVKDEQLDFYKDKFSEPAELANDVSLWILTLVHYTYIDLHNALKNISFKEFQDFAATFVNRLCIQCLAQGNITEGAVIKTIQYCVETFKCNPLHSDWMESFRVTQIPIGNSYCKLKNIDKLNSNSVVINTYQIDVTSIELTMLMTLITKLMSRTMSDQSNASIQNASCDWLDINGILHYSIIARTQKNKYSTESINHWIDESLDWFRKTLDTTSDNALDNVKERIKLEFQQHVDMDLSDEVIRNWNEIMMCRYMFDSRERETLALNEIKMNDLREWFAKYILNKNTIKKLSIHVVANDLKVQPFALEYIIDDNIQYSLLKDIRILKVEEYKEKLNVFPSVDTNNQLRVQNKWYSTQQ
ncbi:Nardilysin [Cyphomyrmex costatus]|uniref:Nardilysin n=1 Tax=Cyphomyrmex costatus TaxID=456900 RepID=A0A195CD14_9HYME|nr:Nardilysin [Cyphomyrmex costatus]